MRRNGDIAIIEASDWRNTRIKEREVYICMPPVGTKMGHVETTNTNRIIVYGGHDDISVVNFGTLRNSIMSVNKEEFSAEKFQSMCKADKETGQAVLGWTKAIVKSGSENNLVAVVVKGAKSVIVGQQTAGLEHIPNSKYGKVVVFTAIDGMPCAPVEIITGEKFANKYSLIAFPNEFTGACVELSMPEPLFEIATAADKVISKEKIEEMLSNELRGISGLDVACVKVNEKYLVNITKGTVGINITYTSGDGLDVTNGLARTFSVIKGSDGGTLGPDKMQITSIKVGELARKVFIAAN